MLKGSTTLLDTTAFCLVRLPTFENRCIRIVTAIATTNRQTESMMLLTHAQQLAGKALAKAAELDAPVAVVILDTGGRLVLAHRMDRASYITTDMGRMKAEVALALQTPTHVLAQSLGHIPELLDLVAIAFEKAALLPGGFPILADGIVIGGLGISGSGGGQVDVAIGEFALA